MSDDTDQNPEYREYFQAVQRYQNGDSESALFVLDAFEDFRDGFLMLLRDGPINRLTRSHRIFLSNFVKNSALARNLKSTHPINAAFLAAETALKTITIQIRPIETEDLRQEIIEIFLGTLRRYRSRNNQNFLIPYIQVSFPYALTRRVQQLIKDPLVNLASDKILSLESSGLDGYFADVKFLGYHPSMKEIVRHFSTSYEESLAQLEEDNLGISWIRGDSCHEVFDDLSPMERRILRFYAQEMTDAQIAKELGVSYNTAIRRRHHIIAKVRGEYAPPSCSFCNIQIPKASLGRQPRQCPTCKEERRVKRILDRKRRG